jgi:hypothetical protein
VWRTVPLNLTWSMGMLMSDGDEVEANCSRATCTAGLFWELYAEMLSHPRTDACHWSIMQIVEHSLGASHDGFANSCWNVWQCGPADTYQIA